MKLPPSLAAATWEAPPLWPPLLATRSPGAKSDGHAHHAIHLVLTLGGVLRVQHEGTGGEWLRAPGVVTTPDVPHSIDASGTEILLVFIEPESEVGAALLSVVKPPVRLLTTRERDSIARNADPLRIMQKDGQQWTRELVKTLGGPQLATRRLVHPKVRKVLKLLRDEKYRGDLERDDDAFSLERLASAVELSPSRLMHAFTESVGIPLRRYLAWLKLQRAAAAIVLGAPLGQAAATAGFADSAHMTRTFRQMLGMTPSSLRPGAGP